MTQSNRSKPTCILLDERPPPVSQPQDRQKCWVFFVTDSGAEEMGYYMGNGVVHIAGVGGQAQMRFGLEKYTHWYPLSESRLEEFEHAKRNPYC